jgi:hypothetical protein
MVIPLCLSFVSSVVAFLPYQITKQFLHLATDVLSVSDLMEFFILCNIYNAYTAMTRSSAPRLLKSSLPREGNFDSKVECSLCYPAQQRNEVWVWWQVSFICGSSYRVNL